MHYYISSKFFLGVAGYLKRSNKKPTSIWICIGFVDVVLWPKILGNRLGLLTSVLIAMDHFFRCQESTSNFENKKFICQGNFFVYDITRSTCSRIIFRALYISRLYAKLWKKLEKSNLYHRVNNFAWSVNFQISRKKTEIIKAWLLLLMWESWLKVVLHLKNKSIFEKLWKIGKVVLYIQNLM